MKDMRIQNRENQKQRTNAPKGWAEEWDKTVRPFHRRKAHA